MSDPIDRQSAIDALFALYEYQQSIDPTEAADLVRQGIFLAEKKIEKLPSAQPEWIPCNWQNKEENLPQECKSVLICMKDSCGYQIGVSYRTDYNRWEGYGRVNVIAWMPLPEPYREDGETDGDG